MIAALALILAGLFTYSLCRISKDSEDAAERMYQEYLRYIEREREKEERQ